MTSRPIMSVMVISALSVGAAVVSGAAVVTGASVDLVSASFSPPQAARDSSITPASSSARIFLAFIVVSS